MREQDETWISEIEDMLDKLGNVAHMLGDMLNRMVEASNLEHQIGRMYGHECEHEGVTYGDTLVNEDEIKKLTENCTEALRQKGLLIKQWNLQDIEADLSWCGRNGSPTKVHRIQSVVLAAKQSRDVEATQAGIEDMIHELIEDKTIA